MQLQRFKRLQHLLEKSSLYSEFMLQRMERQKEEEITKTSKKERRKKQVDNLLKEVTCLVLYIEAYVTCFSMAWRLEERGNLQLLRSFMASENRLARRQEKEHWIANTMCLTISMNKLVTRILPTNLCLQI